MKTYKYILLDWDGNLAKTLDIWLEAYREVLVSRGFDIPDKKISASFGDFLSQMQKWGVQDPEQAFKETDVIARRRLPDVELYPDALEVLIKLDDSNKKLALITTSPHANIGHLLQKYDIARLFTSVVAGDDVAHHKPHPEPLEKALKELGGNKQSAVMIGDSDKDIEAASNFGIDSILFYPPEHNKFYDFEALKLLGPTHIVDDFRKILDLV
jgi:pyrophosphatase PpaX